MDDLQYGTRNKRGDWAPSQPLELAPFWSWPPQPKKLVGWLIGHFWPWNLLFMTITLLYWNFVVPEQAVLRVLAWDWSLQLLLANWAGLLLFYGAFELRLYRQQVQQRRFKYNGKFPAEQPSDVFWFRSQNLDNFLRSTLISIPIGTAIEAGLLWAFASGQAVQQSWAGHAGWLIGLGLLAPLVHEVHFYCIHRAIHWGPLYRWVHAVHHNSVNPSPWSSLSMHPVEGTAYFGVALWVLAVPAHPFLAVYLFVLAGFGAIVGHIGFDRIEFGSDSARRSGAYAHYLHHKYFEVNYSDNGTFPLDHWFGSWHDGSAEGERRMEERFRRKKARLNAA